MVLGFSIGHVNNSKLIGYFKEKLVKENNVSGTYNDKFNYNPID